MPNAQIEATAFSRSAMTIFAHAIHRLGGSGGACRIRMANQIVEPPWNHLPAQTEAVLAPAALRFLAAIGQPAPVVVDLVLVLAVDREGHRLAEREMRTAVDPEESVPVQHEGAGQNRPGFAGAGIGGSVQVLDVRVREYRGVERRRLLQVVVEPQ